MRQPEAAGRPAAKLKGEELAAFGDWRAETLAGLRALIQEADPEAVEELKWRGTPVWTHAGMICTGETYKNYVKVTFAKGAHLHDPAQLFNASLDGNTRRAIDIHAGEVIDKSAFKNLVRQAVALNSSGKAKPKAKPVGGASKPRKSDPNAPPTSAVGSKARPRAQETKPVRLLAGGNPQVAKADGDAPVQAYIAALPGWKSDIGRRLDRLIVRTVPKVRKAVKWNSPFYGIEGMGWFLGIHTYTHYLKLAFFRGTSLQPLPPGPSKDKETRYLDIREGDKLDEAQLAAWVKQAAALPGWAP